MKKSFWLLLMTLSALTLSACTFNFDVCTRGETKCDGLTVMTCSIEGEWLVALNCPSPQFCDAKQGCVECRDDNDCSDPTPVCNKKVKVCQTIDADCSKGETKCEGDTVFSCSDADKWKTGIDCLKNSQVCDDDKGCVKCRDDKDCSVPEPVCNVNTNTCQAADAYCAKNEMLCDNGSHYVCSDTQKKFNPTLCAGTTPICDEVKGCIECRDNADCKDPKKTVCVANTNICQAVTVCEKGETKCERNRFNRCVSGQWEIDNCSENSQICHATKGCVECLSNEDCTTKLRPFCDAKANSCKDTDGGPCTPNVVKCEGNIFLKCEWPYESWIIEDCSQSQKTCSDKSGCVTDF